MQMTNYRAYLCGGPSCIGPSKHDLKLKRTMASRDGNNIVKGNNMRCLAQKTSKLKFHNWKGKRYSVPPIRKLDLLVGLKVILIALTRLISLILMFKLDLPLLDWH